MGATPGSALALALAAEAAAFRGEVGAVPLAPPDSAPHDSGDSVLLALHAAAPRLSAGGEVSQYVWDA